MSERLTEAEVDQQIEDIMDDYRNEILDGMHRYHGCDLYNNERACRADVHRVDRVILPIVRKMLEDAFDAALPSPAQEGEA